MGLQKFIPLTKVDVAQRLVYGIATAEKIDKANEICDYETTKPYYEKWSAEFAKNTEGKSLGNLRAMHGNVAAGVLKQLAFNDNEKQIEICAKVVDDAEWNKVLEGVYTGFSQGGDYVKRWPDPDNKGVMRYTAEPAEVSLVDNPCLGVALFEVIKEDGSHEMRKFQNTEKPETDPKQPKIRHGFMALDGTFHEKRGDAVKANAAHEAKLTTSSASADALKAAKELEDQIRKREFTQDERDNAADTGAAMEDGSFPIHNTTDLENAIHDVGRAKDPEKAKAHIAARAKALGATDKLPPDWEGSTKKKEEKAMKPDFSKFVKGSETWDAQMAIDALMTIECLLSNETWEALFQGEEEGSQIADLKTVIERLKSFIAAEIMESTRDDGSLVMEMSAQGDLVKAYGGHVTAIHKAAGDIMDRCMKMGMKGEDDPADKGANAGELQKRDAEREEALTKATAENEELTKTLGSLTTTMSEMAKRLAAIEAQPIPNPKAVLFEPLMRNEGDADKAGVQRSEKVNAPPRSASPAEARALAGIV